MYKRLMMSRLRNLSQKYPVVTLLGPRQSGKTTIVRLAFPKYPYVNLEDASYRAMAIEDPKTFIETYSEGVIFDEIQRVPELLSYIQVKVDEADRKGMYILTGSHQTHLHSAVSQSLAGRTSILKLLPMSLQELRLSQITASYEELILTGGYPRIHKEGLPLDNAFSSYLQTYVERDVRQILQIKDLLTFERFLKLVASRVGQLINYSSLAVEVGVSATTIREWVSVLEATYIIIRLEPYFENFGKRQVKSPKLYFTDTGFACHLLGIDSTKQLIKDSLYGHLFENLVILELIKHCYNHAKSPHLYFFRDSSGREIDLIYQQGSSLVPIEIKSSKTFSSTFLKNLKMFQLELPKRVLTGAVIYGGDKTQKLNEFQLLNPENCVKILKD